MLAFAAHAVSRCPRAKAVTFDAFSPSLEAEVLFRSVERIRRPCEGDRVALLTLLSADVVVPAGTRIPIRFVQRIRAAGTPWGRGAGADDGGAGAGLLCLVPPYVRAKAGSSSPRAARFGRHGRLGLAFDSLEVRPAHWVAISGVLDTLEYAKPGAVTDSGLISSGKTSVGGVARSSCQQASRRSRPRRRGRGGARRLLAHPPGPPCASSLVRSGASGSPAARPSEWRPLRATGGTSRAYRDADLPKLFPAPRPHGTVLGDPFNVLLLGTATEIDSAVSGGRLAADAEAVLSQRHPGGDRRDREPARHNRPRQHPITSRDGPRTSRTSWRARTSGFVIT